MAKEVRLEDVKPGAVVRLVGDEKIDGRGEDVIVVLALSASRARVQRVAMKTPEGKPVPFRSVDVAPACPVRVLGSVDDARYQPLVALVDKIGGGKGGEKMPIGKGKVAGAATAAPVKETTKAKPAARAAAASGNGDGRGRPSSFTGKEKIKLLVKENPRREGTRAHKVYSLYKSGMSIADFIAAGGGYGDIRWDVAKNNIELK